MNGLALAIHAIGDQANRVVLDAFEELRTFETKNRIKPLAHRIEHLQLISEEDTRRPADLDIIVSMQPIHATSDMRMADRYWGDRVQQSYGWRSQINSGSKLVFGSDAPVDLRILFLGFLLLSLANYLVLLLTQSLGFPSNESSFKRLSMPTLYGLHNQLASGLSLEDFFPDTSPTLSS